MAMPNSFLNLLGSLKTFNYDSYNIKFSPVDGNILAVSAAENYGIKGNGSLLIYALSAKNPLVQKLTYPDAIFDFTWVISDNGIGLSGSGDGCVQLWRIGKPLQIPELCKKIHQKEISSIESCTFSPSHFSTSSWDSTAALCEINSLSPINTLLGHNGIVYEATWSHTEDRLLATASEDGRALIWSPFTSPKPTLVLPSVQSELLSCDWSYSNQHLLVTASSNAVLYGWDLRFPNIPIFELSGHENAVRKVRFSPFISDEIVSVSYDFSTRLWNCAAGTELSIARQHTEFVYGVDYSQLSPGLVADCSWDKKIHIYRIEPGPPSSFVDTQIHSTLSTDLNKGSSGLTWSGNAHGRPLPPLPTGDGFPNAHDRPLPPIPTETT